MVKLTILFRPPGQWDTFENRYNDFLALIERMPYIIRRQVNSVTGSPQGDAAYYRVLEIYFDSEQNLNQALASPAGQEAGAELFKFPQGSFDTFFADVYEETGGYTETSHE